MGQNLTRQKLQNNLKDFFPDLSQYQAYEQNTAQDEPVFIWQDKIKKQSLIEYQYWLKDEVQYSNLLNAFVFRYNNQSLLSTKFIIVQFRGLEYFVRVFYERSISNLSYFKEIPYNDMGYFMMQSLKGFLQLKKRFGCFHVQDDMFHITDKKQVKIWVKQKVYDNSPNLKVCSFSQMIEQILNIIEKNTSFNLNSQNQKYHQTPVLISNQLKKRMSNFQSFQSTIQNLSQIIDQQVYDIGYNNQNFMKCLDQLQYHELIVIMQQVKNKIKSRSSSPIKETLIYYPNNRNNYQYQQNYKCTQNNKKNYTQQQKQFYSQQSFCKLHAKNEYIHTQNSFNKNNRSKSGKKIGISLTKNHRSNSVEIKNQAINSKNSNIQTGVNFSFNQSFSNQNSNLSVVSLGKNKSQKSLSLINNKKQYVGVIPITKKTYNKPPLSTIPITMMNSPLNKNLNSISKVSVKHRNNQNFSKQNQQILLLHNDQGKNKKLIRYATCSGDISSNLFRNISNNNLNSPTSAFHRYNISNPIQKFENPLQKQNYDYQKPKPFFFDVNSNKSRNNHLDYNKNINQNADINNNNNDNIKAKEFQIPKIYIHEPLSTLTPKYQQKISQNSFQVKNKTDINNIQRYHQQQSNYVNSEFKKIIPSTSTQTRINYFPSTNQRYAVSKPIFNNNSQQNLYTDPQLYEYITNKSLPYSQPSQTKQIYNKRNTFDNFYSNNKDRNKQITSHQYQSQSQNNYQKSSKTISTNNNRHHPLEDINISESINFTQNQMENYNNNNYINQKNYQNAKDRQKERKFDLYFPTITQIQEINQSGRSQNNQSFLPIKNANSYKLSTRRRGTQESVVVQYKRFYQQSQSNSNRCAVSPIKQTFKQNNDKVIMQKQVIKKIISYQPTIDPMVLQDLNRMKQRQFA